MTEIKDQYTKVKFKKDNGPITIEVTSGFSSLGAFILAYSKIGETDLTEFGREPKRIDDSIPDIFCIPIDVENIIKYVVIIIGKYCPAPGKTQVTVKYDFVQNGEILKVEPSNGSTINEVLTTGGSLRFTHYFNFEEC